MEGPIALQAGVVLLQGYTYESGATLADVHRLRRGQIIVCGGKRYGPKPPHLFLVASYIAARGNRVAAHGAVPSGNPGRMVLGVERQRRSGHLAHEVVVGTFAPLMNLPVLVKPFGRRAQRLTSDGDRAVAFKRLTAMHA